MPRFWAIFSFNNFRIGGLFTGLISLIMSVATIFGFVVLFGAAILYLPPLICIVFASLVVIGVILGIYGIRHQEPIEDETHG